MSKKISKKTLNRSFLTWLLFNGCSQQAESMLGLGFGHAIAGVIDELYDTPEEKAEALKRHIMLFNTEAQVGSISNGIICGLEEENANGNCTPEVINSIKVALIGPTSAIGDSLWVATFIPILLTICLSIAQASPEIAWIGALIYMIAYPIITTVTSWSLFKLGYRSGVEGMQNIMATGKLDSITNTMGILGLLVVGALSASFVRVSVPIQIVKDIYDATTGEMLKDQVLFNADTVLDSIFPKLLPLLLTLLVYYLYAKRQWSPLKLMGLILLMAAILTGIGFWSGVYQ